MAQRGLTGGADAGAMSSAPTLWPVPGPTAGPLPTGAMFSGAGAAASGGMGAAPVGLAGGGGGRLEMEEADAEEGSVDISRVTGRVKSSSYNRLNELVEKHPDEALSVIRQWASKRS